MLDTTELGGVLNLLRHHLATKVEEATTQACDLDVDLVIPEFSDFMWFHLFIVSGSVDQTVNLLPTNRHRIGILQAMRAIA